MNNTQTIINTFKKGTYFLFLFLLLFSCNAPKDVVYFQGLKNLEEIKTNTKITTTFKPQDIISILVSSADNESAVSFNSGITSEEKNNITAQKTVNKPTYLIDTNGMIDFPVLGKLKIAGLSNMQVKELLKQKLKAFIKDPVIAVNLENFKITVLGDVSSPGSFLINNERVTLIEALGLAGDLSITGKRTNITVIREENNKQIIHKLDLTSKDIFKSPVFYLAQNDVVYVTPNKAKINRSRSNNWPRILTSVSSVLGIIISVIVLTR